MSRNNVKIDEKVPSLHDNGFGALYRPNRSNGLHN